MVWKTPKDYLGPCIPSRRTGQQPWMISAAQKRSIYAGGAFRVDDKSWPSTLTISQTGPMAGRGGRGGGGWRLVPTATGSPILQPEALYCNWIWICAKPETTISQPANKLTFCMVSNLMVNLRKHIHFQKQLVVVGTVVRPDATIY